MNFCLFCKEILDDSTRPEHILLNGLGGRKTTTRVICSSCNESLGASIDNELCQSVAAIRNYLNFPKGDGSPAPTIQRDDPVHGRVVLLPGGMPLSRNVVFNAERDGDLARLNFVVPDLTKLQQLIPHAARRLGLSEERIREELRMSGAEWRYQYLSRVNHHMSFGSDHSQRAMAKMCLILLATHMGVDATRALDVRAAIEFVSRGRYKSKVSRGFQSKQLNIVEGLIERFGNFHNAIIVRVTEHRGIYGYFRLYNGPAWLFCLTQRSLGKRATYTLFSNPQNPSIWSEDDLGASQIPDAYFIESDCSEIEERMHELLVRVIETYSRAARLKGIENLVNDVMYEELDLSPDQVLTEQQIYEIARRLSEAVTMQLFRIPNSRPFHFDD